jgi:hypothetical protein
VPDWAIALITAITAGLGAAILGPVVSYGLDRFRSKESIRKGYQHRLRRMVESNVARGHAVVGAAYQIGLAQLQGHPFDPQVKQGWLHMLMQARDATEAYWAPERIGDQQLQQWVRDYVVAGGTLLEVIQPTPIDVAEVIRLTGQIDVLRGQIHARMDALGWPEVDV